MKSERRHELQHNALLFWLEDTFTKIKPYQNAILGVVLLIAVAILAIGVWSNRSAADTAMAWNALKGPLAAKTPDELDRAAQQYPNTPAAQWATVLAADQHLVTGAMRLFENKLAATEELNKAFDRYLTVYKNPHSDLVRERATFGLARTSEAQGSAEKIGKAIEFYKEVVKNWPKGMFRATAEARLQDLERQPTKWFYDEFAKFEPKPPAPKDTGLPSSKDNIGPPADNPPDSSSLKYRSPFGTDLSGKGDKAKEPAKPAAEPEKSAPAKPQAPAK